MRLAGQWNSKRRGQTRNGPAPRLHDGRDRRRRVRALAAQLDALVDNAVVSQDVSALEKRVDTLIGVINTSRAAGEALPRDLEKLLARFVRKLKRARTKRVSKPYQFVLAAGKVAVTVGVSLLLFVGLHIADHAGLFDEFVSFLAEQAQSLQFSWMPAEPALAVAQANQAPLELAPRVMPNPTAGVVVGAVPSAPAPEITGALPPAVAAQSAPIVPDRSAAIVELPVTIGTQELRAAALAGDSTAAYEVASRFAEGRGVPQSHQEEARWLVRAANQGLAPAQFRLGRLYEKGIGVEKDLARARDFYLAAALKGNANAMHNLAVLYGEGVNGAPDYETAAAWFHKAADHGIKDSQYNLGIFYARGIGVQQNYAESYKWFVLAANQGDGDAAIKRDEVAAYLDPQTREAAQHAARSWSPQPQPADAIEVRIPAAWELPVEPPRAAKPVRAANAKQTAISRADNAPR